MKRLLKFSFLMVMASMLMVGVVGCGGSSSGSGGTTPGPAPAPTDPMIGIWVIYEKGPASPNAIGGVIDLKADGTGTLFGIVITWSKTGAVLTTKVVNGGPITWTVANLAATKVQITLTTNNNIWYRMAK